MQIYIKNVKNTNKKIFIKKIYNIMIYLKNFETMNQYNAYTADTENFILPNVSLTVDNNTVHYNPTTETKVVAKYYVNSKGSTITLFYNQGGSGGSGSGSGGEPPFSAMEIDGDELSEVVKKYTFNTTGEHTVKYTLADPTSIGDYAFYQCSSLTSIEIPSSVTTIGISAFQDCTSLTSCTIGNSVTSIGKYTFYRCTSLTSIVCNVMTAPTIEMDTFYNVKTGGTLYVPIGSSGYDVWMRTSDYYLGSYGWTKVGQ